MEMVESALDEAWILLVAEPMLKLPIPPSLEARGSWKVSLENRERSGNGFSCLLFEPILGDPPRSEKSCGSVQICKVQWNF